MPDLSDLLPPAELRDDPDAFVAWTVEQVKAVEALGGDPESAHVAEDHLHAQVLAAVAEGWQGSAYAAAAALRTRDLLHPKWYA